MASIEKKEPRIAVRTRTYSSDSTHSSLKSPRTPRFAEATSVNSPVEPSLKSTNPFAMSRSNHLQPQPQVSDVGFGYINQRASTHTDPGVEVPATPKSPLKSAMKSPGAAPRQMDNPLSPTFKENPLSPTWKEEKAVEKTEKRNDKRQAQDLKIKVRVRMAKMLLRGTNFACSLIVLAMLSATFTIFNATVNLPTRGGLPAWSPTTPIWPQITVLVIASISLLLAVVVFYAYFRGGHKRAEKVALYYATFSCAFFAFSIAMWIVGMAILFHNKTSGQGTGMWGWSCKNNNRKLLFQDTVDYDLVCRLQNWSFVCCIIEIVVEIITCLVYGIVFYRFRTKRKLTKSMAVRDKARSDLYLAQLRTHTAPNTPGLPMSPREGGYNPMFSPRFAPTQQQEQDLSAAEKGQGEGVQYVTAQAPSEKPFTLMAPPTKGTPKTQQQSFSRPITPRLHPIQPPTPTQVAASPMSPSFDRQTEHVGPAPGERQYGSVPIPGAYSSPLQSPTYAPTGQFGSLR